MNMRAHQAYADTQLETAVHSASPLDLVVLVYDRLLEHLRNAANQLQQGQDSSASFAKALELLNVGLQSCVDTENGAEVAQNLLSIYDWSVRELLLARLRKNPDQVLGVIQTLQPLAEAWKTLAQAQSSGNSDMAVEPFEQLAGYRPVANMGAAA